MGLAPDDAAASVRISLGRSNSEKDIDYVMGFLPELAGRLREEKRSERQ
jgi:cysteine sulfinate desulfinase/cysteine desulfurase-like protein